MDDQFFIDHGIDTTSTFFPSEQTVWTSLTDTQSSGTTSMHMTSPYGLLRPPWNFNPSPLLTRFNSEAGIESLTDVYADTGVDTDKNSLMTYFMGSTCDDYASFLETQSSTNSDVSFDDMVRNVGKYLHGHLHEGVGGQGLATTQTDIDASLRSKYGFTDEDILTIVERSHFFTKNYAPALNAAIYASGLSSDSAVTVGDITADNKASDYPAYPLTCSVDTQDTTGSGTSCVCADYYFESSTNLQALMTLYFGTKYMNFANKDSYTQVATPYKILNDHTFDEQKDIMAMLCTRVGTVWDGDMVGSSTAWDPVFWVAHPAIDRMLHLIQFTANDQQANGEQELSFVNYEFTSTNDDCSGHSSTGTLSWLKGFYFADKDAYNNIADSSFYSDKYYVQSESECADAVCSHELSNADLTALLNPLTNEYATMMNYVYDGGVGVGCADVDDVLTKRL
jgi:hypothetical protein